MRRLASLVARNWPLKLASIGLAFVLYAGLVLSQNARVWPGRIPIVPVRQPASAVLLSNLGEVTNIRFFAPAEVADRLSSSSFTATVDLSQVDRQSGSPFATVKVDVQVADDRIQVLDYEPQVIRVQLDPLVSASVPVTVETGPIPSGVQTQPAQLTVTNVTVSGPESVVRLVTAARAQVVIQPSGIDVDQDVPLVAVDALGNVLGPVDLRPSSVHVRIAVSSQLESRTLPVEPVVVGVPAPGYEVAAVSVAPAAVTVEGDADALAQLDRASTAPVTLTGATADITTTVALALPQGITAFGGKNVLVTVKLRAVVSTRTFSAGVVLSGARGDLAYSLSTDRVLVTLGGPAAALDALDGRSFTVTLDVDGLLAGAHQVAPRVTVPADVTVVTLSPSPVTVTVAAAASPTPQPNPSPSGP